MATAIKRGKKYTAVYQDRNGKQKWLAGYADKASTLRMALKLEDEERKIRLGEIDPIEVRKQEQRRLPIESHIEQYETSLKAAQRSQNHVSYTIADIRQFIECSGVETVGAISRAAVDTWVIKLQALDVAYRESKGEKGEPNSARTINRRVGSVQAFLKWAHAAGSASEYCLSKYTKQEIRGKAIRKSRALSDEETTKLAAWAEVNAPERRKLYVFALLTGCRLNEIATLTASSFNLHAGTVTIHGKDPRHTNRVDTVPLHVKALVIVKDRIKKTVAGPIFDMPQCAAEQLRKDCLAAGIDPKDVNFHGLRHTFVTSLARMNVHPTIVQKLARHRDIAITLGYYTHWSTDDERHALARLMPVE